MQETKKRLKRRLGDRDDGWRLRKLDAFGQIIPYIMRVRSDAHTYFEEHIDVGRTEAWLRKERDAGNVNIGYLHVFVAALVRLLSQRPALNRFIAGQKIYARNTISISLAVKKKMSADAPETTIKMDFDPRASIYDVEKIVEEAINDNKAPSAEEGKENNTDKTAKLFMACPSFIVRFLFFMLRSLDYLGILPRAIRKVSPFHTSVFITDLGSLGIKPIYHHLYDFGTTSIFIAFGKKIRTREINKEGNVVDKKYIGLKVVNDERICDGYYYAESFKLLMSYLKDPSLLEKAPEEVFEDKYI